jgi:hypothetical protein
MRSTILRTCAKTSDRDAVCRRALNPPKPWLKRSTRTTSERSRGNWREPQATERLPVIRSSLYLPEPVYEALQRFAFEERLKIHDVVLVGRDEVLRRRGYPSIESRAVNDCCNVGGIGWMPPCAPRSNKSLVTSSTDARFGGEMTMRQGKISMTLDIAGNRLTRGCRNRTVSHARGAGRYGGGGSSRIRTAASAASTPMTGVMMSCWPTSFNEALPKSAGIERCGTSRLHPCVTTPEHHIDRRR